MLDEICGDADKQRGESLLTTALVIVYLERKLSDLKSDWELIVEKARTWLEGEMEGKEDAYLAAARKALRS